MSVWRKLGDLQKERRQSTAEESKKHQLGRRGERQSQLEFLFYKQCGRCHICGEPARYETRRCYEICYEIPWGTSGEGWESDDGGGTHAPDAFSQGSQIEGVMMRWIVIVGMLLISCSCNAKHQDGISVRFSVPKCHKLSDGTMKCTMKKLPEAIKPKDSEK